MANRLTHIVDAIRTKDYAIATESIAQVLQQKVEQSLAQERARIASTLVREDSKSISMKCQECGKTFKSASLDPKCPKCGGYDIDLSEEVKIVRAKNGKNWDIVKDGKVVEGGFFSKDAAEDAAGEYRKDIKEEHNSGQGWPTKEAAEEAAAKVRKYDDREITVVKDGKWFRIHYGPELDEAFKEKKEKFLCHDCGNVFLASGRPAQCPECKCRKCIETDEPLSESFGDASERIVRHTCKGCGNYWMGPAYEDECPKCFKRQFGECGPACGKSHKLTEKTPVSKTFLQTHNMSKYKGKSLKKEDSSGGRATPGPCAKCKKPAQWYHNRLDKKFCADCAPNDTMSRIQPVKD